jgi:hypothetical protein
MIVESSADVNQNFEMDQEQLIRDQEQLLQMDKELQETVIDMENKQNQKVMLGEYYG